MAAAFYAEQPHTIAAVTGTNGKTSVAHFTRQIWTALGNGAVSLGTLGLQMPDGSTKPRLTTLTPSLYIPILRNYTVRASPMPCWKHPATASTSDGWTASG